MCGFMSLTRSEACSAGTLQGGRVHQKANQQTASTLQMMQMMGQRWCGLMERLKAGWVAHLKRCLDLW